MSRAPKDAPRTRSRTVTESSRKDDDILPAESLTQLGGPSGNLELPFAERLDALRSATVTFKKKKRFLVLDSSRLHLLKSSEDTKPPFLTIALQFCKARPSSRDPLGFEVLTSSENYFFALDKDMSGGSVQEWVEDLQKVCERLVLHTIGGEKKNNLLDRSYSMLISADDARKAGQDAEQSPSLTENQRQVMEIAIRPGNRACADCGAPQPEWASTNLGIFVCIDCAGPHRSFGSHVSKMRGVKLDRWDQPELLCRLDEVGNVASNAIYEAAIPDNFPLARPTPATGARERLEWISLKYVDRRFTADWTPPTEEEIAARDPEHARRKAQEKRLEELKNAAADIRKRDNKQMLLKLLQEDASFRHEVRLLLLQDVDLEALKQEIDAMKASHTQPQPASQSEEGKETPALDSSDLARPPEPQPSEEEESRAIEQEQIAPPSSSPAVVEDASPSESNLVGATESEDNGESNDQAATPEELPAEGPSDTPPPSVEVSGDLPEQTS